MPPFLHLLPNAWFFLGGFHRHRRILRRTLRRRANIACAELALTLMLMLSRRVNELNGRISAKERQKGVKPEPKFRPGSAAKRKP